MTIPLAEGTGSRSRLDLCLHAKGGASKAKDAFLPQPYFISFSAKPADYLISRLDHPVWTRRGGY